MASPYGDMEKTVQQYEAMIEKRDDALALDRQGLTTLALQGYREYITARKALFKYVGEERDAPHVPSAMHRIAVAYAHANEHLKAIDLYKQALQYYHSHLGPEHLETAAAYTNLGVAFQNIGRHDHAIKMLRASLKVRDAKLGKDHLDTADVSHSLAFSLEELGEVREALALYEEAARVRRAEIPASTDTAATIHNAGALLCKSARTEDRKRAAEYFAEAEPLWSDVSHAATSAHLLGEMLLSEDIAQFKESERAFRRALRWRRETLGMNHIETGRTIVGLALCLARQHEQRAALDVYEEAIRIYSRLPERGAKHEETLRLVRVAASLRKMLDEARARDEWRMAVQKEEMRREERRLSRRCTGR